MDEYAGGPGAYYRMNRPILERGLELLNFFKEDLKKLAARDLHDLLRCWELWDRVVCAEAHIHHVLFREETRWPGYYYRTDHPKLDDENWKCFTTSQHNVDTGEFKMEKQPYIPVCD